MRIYFEDLKPEIQSELVNELVTRLRQEEIDETGDCLSERAAHLINCRNNGVDMDF